MIQPDELEHITCLIVQILSARSENVTNSGDVVTEMDLRDKEEKLEG